MPKKAIIIGAGPAGLTAAYELLKRTGIKPVLFETSDSIGGISRTVRYKGNRIDVGPHRFFSKSDRVLDLWEELLPLQGALAKDDLLLGRAIPLSKKPGAPDPEKTDRVMLFKQRLTRIFFLRKFFDYPISLNTRTIFNLGPIRLIKAGVSYLWYISFPIKDEKNLEDFYINRFGRELYKTFFKDYTRKVWGVACSEIPKDWGAQRVKNLSIVRVIAHAVKNVFKTKYAGGLDTSSETSLVEGFLYPKLGAGHLYEEMARVIIEKGGEIHFNKKIVGVMTGGDGIQSVSVENTITGVTEVVPGDYFFSTMPIKELIAGFKAPVPEHVRTVAEGLVYRDFITVGVLLKKMKLKNDTNIPSLNGIIADNWIYIQERSATMGRLDVFNNFSPYMLADMNTVWLGCEYFCSEGDEIWNKSDDVMVAYAIQELYDMDMIDKEDVLDHVVIRQQKAYPAYFGTYGHLNIVCDFVDQFHNLFLIGRNGMHKYNNMDHSILTAMVAVDNIANGIKTKDNIWAVNTEEEYHEEGDKK